MYISEDLYIHTHTHHSAADQLQDILYICVDKDINLIFSLLSWDLPKIDILKYIFVAETYSVSTIIALVSLLLSEVVFLIYINILRLLLFLGSGEV